MTTTKHKPLIVNGLGEMHRGKNAETLLAFARQGNAKGVGKDRMDQNKTSEGVGKSGTDQGKQSLAWDKMSRSKGGISPKAVAVRAPEPNAALGMAKRHPGTNPAVAP